MSRFKKSQSTSSSRSSSNIANNISHEQKCEFTVAVLGVSGACQRKSALLNDGVGKSCLCSRFVNTNEDEYDETHPSELGQADFYSPAVNRDHWLYWGTRDLTVTGIPQYNSAFLSSSSSVSATTSTQKVRFHVIEQTEFCDDHTFLPFATVLSYDMNCNATTTDGLTSSSIESINSSQHINHYKKRCLQLCLQSRGKCVYRHSSQLHSDDGEYNRYGTLPMGNSKSAEDGVSGVVTQGFIFVYDISPLLAVRSPSPFSSSATQTHPQDIQLVYLLEILRSLQTLKYPLPLVVALCKGDYLLSMTWDMCQTDEHINHLAFLSKVKDRIHKAVTLYHQPRSLSPTSHSSKSHMNHSTIAPHILPIITCSARESIQVDLVFQELFRLSITLRELGGKSKRRPSQSMMKRYRLMEDNYVEACQKGRMFLEEGKRNLKSLVHRTIKPFIKDLFDAAILDGSLWRYVEERELIHTNVQWDVMDMHDEREEWNQSVAQFGIECCLNLEHKFIANIMDGMIMGKYRMDLDKFESLLATLLAESSITDSDESIEALLNRIRKHPDFESYFYLPGTSKVINIEGQILWNWMQPSQHLVSPISLELQDSFYKLLRKHWDALRAKNAFSSMLWSNRYPHGLAIRPATPLQSTTIPSLHNLEEWKCFQQLEWSTANEVYETFQDKLQNRCLRELVDLLWETLDGHCGHVDSSHEDVYEELLFKSIVESIHGDSRYLALDTLSEQRRELLEWIQNSSDTKHFNCPWTGSCIDKTMASALNTAYRQWLLCMKRRSEDSTVFVVNAGDEAAFLRCQDEYELHFTGRSSFQTHCDKDHGQLYPKLETISSIESFLKYEWPTHPKSPLLLFYSNDEDLAHLREGLYQFEKISGVLFEIIRHSLIVLVCMSVEGEQQVPDNVVKSSVVSILQRFFVEVEDVCCSSTACSIQPLIIRLEEWMNKMNSSNIHSNESGDEVSGQEGYSSVDPHKRTMSTFKRTQSVRKTKRHSATLSIHIVCFCPAKNIDSCAYQLINDIFLIFCGPQLWNLVPHHEKSIQCKGNQLTLNVTSINQQYNCRHLELVFRSYHAEMVDLRSRQYADAYILLYNEDHKASYSAAHYFQQHLLFHLECNKLLVSIDKRLLNLTTNPSDNKSPLIHTHPCSQIDDTSSQDFVNVQQRIHLLTFMKESLQRFTKDVIPLTSPLHISSSGDKEPLHSSPNRSVATTRKVSSNQINNNNFSNNANAQCASEPCNSTVVSRTTFASHSASPNQAEHEYGELNETTCFPENFVQNGNSLEDSPASKSASINKTLNEINLTPIEVDLIYSIPLCCRGRRTTVSTSTTLDGEDVCSTNGSISTIMASHDETITEDNSISLKKDDQSDHIDVYDKPLELVLSHFIMSFNRGRQTTKGTLQSCDITHSSESIYEELIYPDDEMEQERIQSDLDKNIYSCFHKRSEGSLPLPFYQLVKPSLYVPPQETVPDNDELSKSLEVEKKSSQFFDRRRWLSGPAGNENHLKREEIENAAHQKSSSKKSSTVLVSGDSTPKTAPTTQIPLSATPSNSSKTFNFFSLRIGRKHSTPAISLANSIISPNGLTRNTLQSSFTTAAITSSSNATATNCTPTKENVSSTVSSNSIQNPFKLISRHIMKKPKESSTQQQQHTLQQQQLTMKKRQQHPLPPPPHENISSSEESCKSVPSLSGATVTTYPSLVADLIPAYCQKHNLKEIPIQTSKSDNSSKLSSNRSTKSKAIAKESASSSKVKDNHILASSKSSLQLTSVPYASAHPLSISTFPGPSSSEFQSLQSLMRQIEDQPQIVNELYHHATVNNQTAPKKTSSSTSRRTPLFSLSSVFEKIQLTGRSHSTYPSLHPVLALPSTNHVPSELAFQDSALKSPPSVYNYIKPLHNSLRDEDLNHSNNTTSDDETVFLESTSNSFHTSLSDRKKAIRASDHCISSRPLSTSRNIPLEVTNGSDVDNVAQLPCSSDIFTNLSNHSHPLLPSQQDKSTLLHSKESIRIVLIQLSLQVQHLLQFCQGGRFPLHTVAAVVLQSSPCHSRASSKTSCSHLPAECSKFEWDNQHCHCLPVNIDFYEGISLVREFINTLTQYEATFCQCILTHLVTLHSRGVNMQYLLYIWTPLLLHGSAEVAPVENSSTFTEAQFSAFIKFLLDNFDVFFPS